MNTQGFGSQQWTDLGEEISSQPASQSKDNVPPPLSLSLCACACNILSLFCHYLEVVSSY
jgi:hypothetical protein